MKKPILVVMAAGMGSRYGGLKQMDPVGPAGQIIMDYSIYDALQAGFGKVIFVIKEEMAQEFRTLIGERISRFVPVAYCYQKLDALPAGFCVPEGRVKPWGTAHAVLTAAGEIDAPFAVINADDYYGPEAFRLLADALLHPVSGGVYPFAMVGYRLGNTLTENGHVARGVCEIDKNGCLAKVTERTRIQRRPEGVAYSEDGGESWTSIGEDRVVSMNMWGFTEDFLREAEEGFSTFLEKAYREDPLKAEYFLPSVVSRLIQEGKAQVRVLPSGDKWYGVTYREDKPLVQKALAAFHAEGMYPAVMLGLSAEETAF